MLKVKSDSVKKNTYLSNDSTLREFANHFGLSEKATRNAVDKYGDAFYLTMVKDANKGIDMAINPDKFNDKGENLVAKIDGIVEKIYNDEDLSYQDLVDLQDNQEFIKERYPNEPQIWQNAGISEEEWLDSDKPSDKKSTEKKETKTESPNGDWFDNLSEDAKKEYKKNHPNSKYAKGSKGLRLKVKASFSGSKTIKDTNQTLDTVEKRLQVRFRDFRADIKRNSGPNLRSDLRILLSDIRNLQKYLEALATDLDNNNISDK